LEHLSDGPEGAVLAERPHAEDFGLGNLLDTLDATLVHQQLGDCPGPAFETAQKIMIAVGEGFQLSGCSDNVTGYFNAMGCKRQQWIIAPISATDEQRINE